MTFNIPSFQTRHALNRVLGEDVRARDPLPPFPASIKDGYAVLAADCPATSLKVLGDSSAGDAPVEAAEVVAGFCVRINTGAPIPAGADAVVQVEDTQLVAAENDGEKETEVEILKPAKVGQDIRRMGSDIAKGQTVLAAGAVLGPNELGLLATVGVAKVVVYQTPIVGVLSTGNELVEPDVEGDLPQGSIRDANRTTLISLLKESGIPHVDLGIAKDTPDALLKALFEAMEKCDVIVSTGGVSMGERDYLKEVLTVDLEATIHFGRVFMKPGKPTTFATKTHVSAKAGKPLRKKLFFGLPGNPVSAAVTANLYVIPACRLIAGRKSPKATVIRAKVMTEVKLDPRPEFHRCVLEWREGEDLPTAVSTGNQISSRLLSMSNVNGLAMLPSADESEDKVLAAGATVDVMVIGRV